MVRSQSIADGSGLAELDSKLHDQYVFAERVQTEARSVRVAFGYEGDTPLGAVRSSLGIRSWRLPVYLGHLEIQNVRTVSMTDPAGIGCYTWESIDYCDVRSLVTIRTVEGWKLDARVDRLRIVADWSDDKVGECARRDFLGVFEISRAPKLTE
jgi:hypothetical protein